MLGELRAALRRCGSKKKAALLSRFFKTGPGEYGHGDTFLGVTVPDIRRIAKKYGALGFSDLEVLLMSDVHEERLCALLILVHAFVRGNAKTRQQIARFYVRYIDRINNWDLVDLSAPKILGQFLIDTRDAGGVLVKLAKSKVLWHRRIAIIATYQFIYAGKHIPTFNIAQILLEDSHDLIQKAVGWMLREVGKRIDQETEEEFLRAHYRRMPRTMLRYAVERFPQRLRRAYLDAKV